MTPTDFAKTNKYLWMAYPIIRSTVLYFVLQQIINSHIEAVVEQFSKGGSTLHIITLGLK